MTFGDMILDCAERWGHADETGTLPGIPTDAAVLDKIKRKINAGYAEFLRADRKWCFLRQRYELTWYPDGDGPYNIPTGGSPDGGRYRLPTYLGSQPLTDWTYVTTGRPPSVIQNVSGETVRRQQASFRMSGVPMQAGCLPILTGDGVGGQPKGWEVLFYPRPASAYTVEAVFSVRQHVLTELHERHVAGSDHDRTIIAYADHQWFKDDAENPLTSQTYEAEMLRMKALSMEIDKERRPRVLGKLRDSSSFVPVSRWTNLGTVKYDGARIV